ncbi:DNA mismatch repair protein MutS [Anaerosinus massiliensis]|uniref:DNA mismatch repair protein MutS n=1 Tax=Massilibacillus massiliensis TaxID=1806837 RepID=UPI000B0BEC2A|nr:DNA mismatch repair protein MutS [Massilibacillus massiliensis]
MAITHTPMIEQYKEIKRRHPNEILFFRLGDFYEMFFEDAELASRELEITLTGRDAGQPARIPMCGIPYHAAETYIIKLIHKGYKVAICEQTGDVKSSKGLVKREVIKIITPGTVLSESVLTDATNQYIALIYQDGAQIVLAGSDVSTGECFYGLYEAKSGKQNLFDQLYRLMPPEIMIVGQFAYQAELKEFVNLRLGNCSFTEIHEPAAAAENFLDEHFKVDEQPNVMIAKQAVGTLLEYLHQTIKTDLTHLNQLTYLDESENLIIDTYTLRNLEITRNLRDGGKKDTLLGVLDFTHTAMGSRLLKKWLEYPLLNIAKIKERQETIAELVDDFSMRENLREELKEIYDFERLITRIEVGTANARDLVSLKLSLASLPKIKNELVHSKTSLLKSAYQKIYTYQETVDLLDRAIVDTPGISLRDGGIIKEGYDKDLDELRIIAKDSRKMLQDMEQKEKESTGIKSLKIGYNKVFGYYIEVTHSNTSAVPDYYIRKQTLANAERYITPDLKEFETKILGAQEKIVGLEYQLFIQIRDQIKTKISSIQQTAHQVAIVDTLLSLSEAASRYNYTKPTISTQGEIIIKDGRHPLVERILNREMFVPNDTELNHMDSEVMVITGPNMAGKSTYMRQVALLTLMAQVGSFIPVREATISPVDRIFTRIGASDDLVSGQSTFMVEMNEVAQILKFATKRSLIILDEIGRGTSTFDGMSIARAVIEHVHDKIGAKTLFATHYHELTDLEDYAEGIKNYCVAVKERGSEVVFLRRIVAGGADKSYGIHVAKLAGLPKIVTERAKKILTELENQHVTATHIAATQIETIEQKIEIKQEEKQIGKEENYKSKQKDEGMSSLFASGLSEQILTLDLMSMTPLEAMNILYQLQNQAKGEAGKL